MSIISFEHFLEPLWQVLYEEKNKRKRSYIIIVFYWYSTSRHTQSYNDLSLYVIYIQLKIDNLITTNIIILCIDKLNGFIFFFVLTKLFSCNEV